MNIIGKITNRLKKNEGASYQEKRDNDQNWKMIEEHLDNKSRNLLDIACDAGFYSFKAAEKGLFVVGLDILEPSLRKGVERVFEEKKEGIGFMKMSLSPSNLSMLPEFDIVLCLSVYHHFFRLYGEEDAKKMVKGLFEICKRQMFFQIPSKKGKYGADFSCDFTDDRLKIEKYVNDLFAEVDDCSVKLIGKKKEKPPTENYRYLFLIEKNKG